MNVTAWFSGAGLGDAEQVTEGKLLLLYVNCTFTEWEIDPDCPYTAKV